MNILGISAYYHDSAACLVRDGKIIAAAQEERFTRKKHDSSFPLNAVRFCLGQAGISAGDIGLVVFYDKPWLKFERILETYLAFAPRGFGSFMKSMPLWVKKKLWMKELLHRDLDSEAEIIFTEHHESHAASAFFPSPFEEAAFLTMDGVGEWATTSYGVGKGNRVDLMAEIHFPHSLGLLYSAFAEYTGFRVNSGEYKVMGLAPYGEARFRDLILDEIISVKDDGSFRLNMDYFDYCAGLTMTNNRFHDLFGGPPRKAESALEQRHMDLARSVQEVVEAVVLKIATHVRAETGQRNLCLAGGVALNCVANGKLLRAGVFDDLWIQPASGDAGGALGAALFGWHQYGENPRRTDARADAMAGSFLGPSFDEEDIGRFLRENGITAERLDEEALLKRMSTLLSEEKIIGWFQGRMEFGPRALGARSILCDPRSPKMREKINRKVKFRESFRPFAPAVLAQKAGEYFDLDRPSPYMLLVADVRNERRRAVSDEEKTLHGMDKLKVVRSDIPAVTHVDYSARIQTVHMETNPLFYKLLERFNDDHGCAVLINTSFNVRGEPIVCTPEDAYSCFMRTDMDYLVLGSYLLDKAGQEPLEEGTGRQIEFVVD